MTYFDNSSKEIVPYKEGIFTGVVKKVAMRLLFCPFPEPHESVAFFLDVQTEEGMMKVKVFPGAVDPLPPYYQPRPEFLCGGLTEEYLLNKRIAFGAVKFEGMKAWESNALITENVEDALKGRKKITEEA